MKFAYDHSFKRFVIILVGFCVLLILPRHAVGTCSEAFEIFYLGQDLKDEADAHRRERGKVTLSPDPDSRPPMRQGPWYTLPYRFLGWALDGPHSSATEHTLEYRGNTIPNVVAQYDWPMGTYRYFPEVGRFPEGCQVGVPIIGGIGALETSHAGTTAEWVRIFAEPKSSTAKKTAGLLRTEGLALVPTTAETLDWPWQGNAVLTPRWDLLAVSARTRRWSELGDTTRTLGRYLHGYRASGPKGMKVVPLGQSAGCAFVGAVNQSNSKLMDAMILIGPVIPGKEAGGPESDANYRSLVERGAFKPNLQSFDWASRQIGQMDWSSQYDPFGGKPVLIMVGELDPEVPETTKRWLRTMAERFPDRVEFHVIPGAPHNVLTSFKRGDLTYRSEYAWSLIHKFLHRHGLSGAIAP